MEPTAIGVIAALHAGNLFQSWVLETDAACHGAGVTVIAAAAIATDTARMWLQHRIALHTSDAVHIIAVAVVLIRE